MLEENIKNDEIAKLKNDINFKYIKNYNFKRYLIGLLNDKFPDQYFKS